MAAFGASFESENSIEDRKENKRKARQEVVEKAKQCYEREEKKKELKKLRGEDTWMLPELDQRLKQIGQEDSLQSKKRKKEKKSKKAKKEKKKKKRDKKEKRAGTGDGCSDSSEDSEEEWVEAQPQPETVKGWKIPAEAKAAESSRSPAQDAKRDEWMTFDFLAMKTTSTTERRAEKDRLKGEEKSKAEAIEQAGLHKLELNPFWKDGGSGLPPEKNAVAVAEAKRVSAVNDGGLSWLKKSYQRMREQAERDNCSLNEIVAQRYGSMEEFQKRLAEAEEAAYGAPRRGGNRGMGRGNWRRGDRDSWRRGEGDTADREGWGRNERERDSSPRDGGRRWERSGEPREQGSERERGPGEGRYRERDRSRDRNRGEDDRDGERKRRSMDRDEERPRERERANNRRTDQDREGDGDRERYRDGPRERDGGRSGGSDRAPRDDRPSCREDSSPGRGRHTPPLSLGSLKGRFLKPSEDEDGGVRRSAPDPARLSKAFLKPSSDDEDSPKTVRQHHGVPPSRRESGPAQGTDRPTAPHHGDRVVTEATAPHGNKAAVTSSSEESEEEELPLLTDEEMNKLGAKLVKAEIMGNTALVDKLKSQMELARKAKENHATRLQQANAARASQPPGRSEEDKEVLLFRTDHSGRAWPVNAPSEPQEPHGGRRKRKPIETHVDGERVRYFQDDDSMGLQEMVRREKMSTPQDQNALYSRMAGKMMGKADGDNYTLDDMFVSSAAQREGEGRDEERMRSQAVAESRRLAASMDQCPRCFNSQELQKHLIVAIGAKSYLSLPAGVSMTEGHCLISPLQHHCSATGLDEDIWSEMQLFRRSLVRMFESQDQDCVFMETHMNPRRRQHMVLECVPLPRELGDMAPIYYKKAIMDCDEEWAMNKKVVNLSSKDIRQAVPRGLPYFAVDFGLQGGFAHVIENEQKFPHYFGKEVVGGMMDLEPRRWRKPIRENFDDQRKKVLQFAQWWKPYDCTKTDG